MIIEFTRSYSAVLWDHPVRFEQELYEPDRLVMTDGVVDRVLVEVGRIYNVPISAKEPLRTIRAQAIRIAPGARVWIVTYKPVN